MILEMFRLALIILLVCTSCSKQEYPVNIPDVKLLDGQELITFQSQNPFSFKDIIVNLESQSTQDVYGILTFPKTFDSRKKYPLVIGVAGSMDWRSHHLDYMKMYQSMGIATLELHSFSSRGITSTVGTQIEVTTAMMVLDAYRALEKLSLHENIDTDRAAITGWSLGGAVSLFSAWNPAIEAIGTEFRFSAHLPIYPPCFVQPRDLDFSDADIHILIGELDDWVPADACLELVSKLKDDHSIDITVYPDAHHSYDSKSPLTVQESGYSLNNCRLEMNEEGAVLMNFMDIPMTTPLLQKIGLIFCADRGPTYGGNIEARAQSFEFARKFMLKNLNP